VASAVSNAVVPRTTILEQGVPAIVDAADSSAEAQGIELGVKFSSESAGKISGVRFYKSRRQHGHPRRQPLERHRHAARPGHRRR
jgi:hypothetical protein